MHTVYRGVPCYKSPFDLAIYLQLLARLRPRSVLEIGTKHGGSALFFADMLAADGIDGRVLTVDIDPPAAFYDPRVEVLEGDALDLGSALTDDLLGTLDHPILVVEDSSHQFDACSAVLEFFDRWLHPGDYIVVEDGIVSQLSGRRYERYADGPNRAVAAFLRDRPGRYEIDTSLCDLYGRNATYNPNAWLRRR